MIRQTCLWFITAIPPAIAQESHATLLGWVTDSAGRTAVGAQVILQLEKCDCDACTNEECNCCSGLLLTVTDGQGFFTLISHPGTYSVRAKWPSGQPTEVWGIQLIGGQTHRHDFMIAGKP